MKRARTEEELRSWNGKQAEMFQEMIDRKMIAHNDTEALFMASYFINAYYRRNADFPSVNATFLYITAQRAEKVFKKDC